MSEQHELIELFEEFLVERDKVEIPAGEVARAKLLAKELAIGYDQGLWEYVGTWVGAGSPHEFNIYVRRYFLERWKVWDFQDAVSRLNRHGYTERGELYEELTNAAFAFIDKAEDTQPIGNSYDGFISYKRRESSLLALLARATLQLHEFSPFIDLELNPTDEWHARLEQRVRASTFFVALIGSNTLTSRFVVREINWAIQHAVPILQIRSFGFHLVASEWQDIEFPQVSLELQNQQAIETIANSAEGYQLAMDRLLKAVGMTR